LTPEAAVLVSAVAAVLGHRLTGAQVNPIATHVLAVIAGAVATVRAPVARKTVVAVKKAVTPPKPPAPAMRFPVFGLDWSYATLSAAQLQKLGVRFVCRYLSNDPAKNLTLKESLSLERAGIKRVLVWESTATRALEGYTAGVQDGRAALALADELHAPTSAVIYFAIDFEATGTDVELYFKGAAAAVGRPIGAYGGYAALEHLLTTGAVKYGWQTYAWSGGRWLPRAQLLQYDNGREVFGQSVDFDKALTADCGWW
jgi:hypothetical protein